MLVVFNKPYGVLCQFTGQGLTLGKYINIPGVYPAGRLDKDSEGLLILTDDGHLQNQLTHPRYGKEKTYWIQVDGLIDQITCGLMQRGIDLNDGPANAIQCRLIEPPKVPARNPPVRYRRNIPTSWIEMTLNEGRNRQVRRMTAEVGFPTLRLIRVAIGNYDLNNLLPGEYRVIDANRVESRDAKTRQQSYRRNVRRR